MSVDNTNTYPWVAKNMATNKYCCYQFDYNASFASDLIAGLGMKLNPEKAKK